MTEPVPMFEQYPKLRPPLPPAIARIYAAQYKANREGSSAASSLAQRMEAWLHRQVAADVAGPGGADKATLELGAGTLNQLPHEPGVRRYDIVEPFADLFRDSPRLARVTHVYADIAEVPLSQRYDRITSVATLEHLCDLPAVIARCGLLLAPTGVLRASVPSEGTWLWTLGWKLTTGLEFRLRHGLDYGDLMRHEHVNTADEIEQVLRHFFAETRCRVFGLTRSTSLYRYYECRGPRLDACRQYASGAPA
jgi:SAM-dependent methyltransferase